MKMQSGVFRVFLIFYLFCLVLECHADDIIYVTPDGDASQNCTALECGKEDCPCNGLQNAFLRAGNTSQPTITKIYLLPGIYSGLQNCNISVDYDTEVKGLNGTSQTYISNQTETTIFNVNRGTKLNIAGITFSDISSSTEPAIASAYFNATITILDCIIENNTGELWHIGVQSDFNISSSIVQHNHSPNHTIFDISSASVYIQNCSIHHNNANMLLEGVELVQISVIDTTIEYNNASMGFSWGKLTGEASEAFVVSSTFSANIVQGPMLDIKNSTLIIRDTTFQDSINFNQAAIVTQDSSIFANNLVFLRNRGSEVIDIDISCYLPLDVVMSDITISHSNSGPRNSTSSVKLDGCHLYLAEWTWEKCFTDPQSSGNILLVQSTLAENATVEIQQFNVSDCGRNGAGPVSNLIEMKVENAMQASMIDSEFTNCRVNEIENFLHVDVFQDSSFVIQNTIFTDVINGIYISGDADMNNCEFIGSTGEEQLSSAIFLINGVQKITNTVISRHSSPVIVQESKAYFTECQFQRNIASQPGGALVAQDALISLESCQFEYNTAIDDGGAVYLKHGKAIINNSTFLNNTAAFQSGGALALADDSQATIQGSWFISNSAGYGGALHVGDKSTFSIHETIFDSNFALQAGGGIFLQNNLHNDEIGSYLIACSFNGNKCIHGSGGGLSTHFLAAPTIERTNFTSNSAVSGGGMSITDGSRPIISNSYFRSNFASSSGGGVMIQGFSDPIFTSCVIEYNQANSTGGGLVVKDISSPRVINSSIEYNFSPNEGGAVVFTDKSNSTFENCTVRHNQSGGSGGAFLFAITSSGSFTDCIIGNNVGLSSGGAIAFQNGCFPQFIRVTIANNTASEGGAFSIGDTAAPICNECIFYNNTAKSHGGAIVSSDFSIGNFSGCDFALNVAPAGRGGVIKIDDYARVHFEDCSFVSNRADTGGAIYTSSGVGPSILGCSFDDNHARFHGGAIVFAGVSFGLLENCLVRNNSADERGGAILFQDDSHPFLINVTFIGNNVVLGAEGFGQGGALCLWDTTQANLKNCSVIANSGILGGGAYIHLLSKGTFTNVQFSQNIAQEGGALNFRGFLTTMQNVSISENSAEYGAGIYIDSSLSHPTTSICSNCLIENNSATALGGGVFLRTIFDPSQNIQGLPSMENTNTTLDRESFSFVDAMIVNNTALRGAGIYFSGGVSLVNFGPTCAVIGNTANEFGGGIYINQISRNPSDLVWVSGGNFQLNDAHYAGTNIAWNVVTNDDPGHFCENCIYGDPLDSFNGYQTKDGWATAPSELAFGEYKCPGTLNVESSPFTVSTILRDYFGNNVTGTIDVENNITITVDYYGDCQLVSDSYNEQVNPSTAKTYFQNLTIEGIDKESCQLLFSAPLKRNVFIPPVACNISLYGCPSGESVSSSGTFDTCVPATGDNNPYHLSGNITIFLAAIVGVLLLLIFCIFSFAFYKFGRRKYRRYKMLRTLVPDLERKPMVSLESILNDPQIPHIQWEEISIKDRIGMGANGIVSRGAWKPKSKAILKKYAAQNRVKKGTIEIAVKELLVEQIELLNPITLEEFLIEIKFLSKLDNENVVKFLGISTPSNITKLYLVTELMQYGSLRDVLDRCKEISWPRRLKLAKDAAKGMAYLHKRKLIHRDLKSQNLLVDNTWTCKVADFGISTVKEAKTRTMTCIGTPTYMAPEVLGKAKYSEKADVFSFGILLVEIYTGKVPYSGRSFAHLNQAQLMFKICSEQARPAISHFPEALRELVNDCWNMEPALRPSFPEIVVRLRRLKHMKDPDKPQSDNDEDFDSDYPSAEEEFTSGDQILSNSPWVPEAPRRRNDTANLERVIENLRSTRNQLEEELSDMSAEDASLLSQFSIQ